MKKVDFTGNFKSLNGKDIKDESGNIIEISNFVANQIAGRKTDEPMRTIALAKKIIKEKQVSLEQHDIDYLTGIVKKLELGDIIICEILTRLK